MNANGADPHFEAVLATAGPFMTTVASSSSFLAACNFTRGIVPSLTIVRAGVAPRSSAILFGGATDDIRLRAYDSFVAATGRRVLSSVRLLCRPKREGARARCFVCGITFELSGRQRHDASARAVMMHHVPQAGRWWHAVGAPLERGVMPHSCEVRRNCLL